MSSVATADGGTGHRPPWPIWLAAHAAVWTLAAWLSRGNLDVPGDMVENYVWGIGWQAGYDHHPPLFAWIVAAWFSAMPRADWAYYALSSLNAALGLVGVGMLARRFMPTESAVIAAAALAISPLYTALAIKFNANAVLLSVWPWAAFHFVAYMQRGRWRNAAACGALVALALLGKYFSIVLALALVLAALMVPSWRQRLRGAGPWVALLAAAAVLAPHVLWMFDHQFTTLRFAARRSEGSLGPSLLRLANYTVAQLGYLLPSAALLLGSVRLRQRRAAAALIARSAFQPVLHRELWWLALAPMLVVAAIAIARRTPMASVWGMAQWFAVTALWVAVLDRQGIAVRGEWVRRALPVYWTAVLLVAPAVGYVEARRAAPGASEPRAELARAAHALWRERSGRALKIVAGSVAEARSVAFYAPGKTHWWNPAAPATTPWVSAAEWQREGGLLVCTASDLTCSEFARTIVALPPIELTVNKRAWGIDLPAHTYRLYLKLPA